ncbi:hypothetical protein RRG08_063801 [Elysia crispata]|uniref:Uncharacterized protein n=1 Tax=Elysia crispata TaxID=231223 RepID=A0AAE1ALT3_9GAST|nr:hypothetical protein RRG08_063801 [Elysia crispata]
MARLAGRGPYVITKESVKGHSIFGLHSNVAAAALKLGESQRIMNFIKIWWKEIEEVYERIGHHVREIMLEYEPPVEPSLDQLPAHFYERIGNHVRV